MAPYRLQIQALVELVKLLRLHLVLFLVSLVLIVESFVAHNVVVAPEALDYVDPAALVDDD